MKTQFRTSLKDTAVFVIILLVTNALWSFFIKENITDNTPIFAQCLDILTWEIKNLLHFLGKKFICLNHRFVWLNGHHFLLAWSCTAVKQWCIFAAIVLLGRGRWVNKIIFCIAAIAPIHAFNVLRIFIVALLIEKHYDIYPLFHDHIFKYLFYLALFALWIFWIERFADK